jgi:hypothetical protein
LIIGVGLSIDTAGSPTCPHLFTIAARNAKVRWSSTAA